MCVYVCSAGYNCRRCAAESYTNTPTPSGEGEKHVTHSGGLRAERPGGVGNAALFSTSFLLATTNKCALRPPTPASLSYTALHPHRYLVTRLGPFH